MLAEVVAEVAAEAAGADVKSLRFVLAPAPIPFVTRLQLQARLSLQPVPPPLITREWPVTQPASSLAKYTTPAATSLAVPTRRIG